MHFLPLVRDGLWPSIYDYALSGLRNSICVYVFKFDALFSYRYFFDSAPSGLCIFYLWFAMAFGHRFTTAPFQGLGIPYVFTFSNSTLCFPIDIFLTAPLQGYAFFTSGSRWPLAIDLRLRPFRD